MTVSIDRFQVKGLTEPEAAVAEPLGPEETEVLPVPEFVTMSQDDAVPEMVQLQLWAEEGKRKQEVVKRDAEARQ